jgi:hypothetical protein
MKKLQMNPITGINNNYFNSRPDLYSIKLPFSFIDMVNKFESLSFIKLRFIEFIKETLIPFVEINNLQNIDNDQSGYFKLLDYVNTGNLPISFRLGETKTNMIMKNFCLLNDEVSLDLLKFSGFQFHFIITHETTSDPTHFMHIYPKVYINGYDEDFVSYNLLKRDNTISLENIENKILNNIKCKLIGIDWKKMDLELEDPIYIENASTKPKYSDFSLQEYDGEYEETNIMVGYSKKSKSRKTRNDTYTKKAKKRIKLDSGFLENTQPLIYDRKISEEKFIVDSVVLSMTDAEDFYNINQNVY